MPLLSPTDALDEAYSHLMHFTVIKFYWTHSKQKAAISNDFKRIHEMYNLPQLLSQMAFWHEALFSNAQFGNISEISWQITFMATNYTHL